MVTATLIVALAFPGSASAVPPTSCGAVTPEQVFTGSFGRAQQGSYLLVPFEVEPGITVITVRLCHDQVDLNNSFVRHTLDLGIYEPSAQEPWHEDSFRGWGGSSRLNVTVTAEAESTTVGFMPGDIPSGKWAAEIGVAAVSTQTEGDADGLVNWRLEVSTASDPSFADQPFTPAPYDEAPAATGEGWYKGDFHVHARNSHPSDATMKEVFDYAFTRRPAGAGLDFITLSDYMTKRPWAEIGSYQAGYPGKLILRSEEMVTYRGHLQNHNSARHVDYHAGPIFMLRDGVTTKVANAISPSSMFRQIHANGGITQVNHPTAYPATIPAFSNFCRGCSWEFSDAETDWIEVDAFEIQQGPSGLPEPKGSEMLLNPFTPLAIEEWDRLHAQGFPITAVGASDSHKAGGHGPNPQDQILQGPIGEPTTVVFARELSEKGIQEAILAGHAYVKFFSSDGPDLRLEATPPGGTGAPAIMGDEIPEQRADFTAAVIGAAPANPRLLLVMRDGLPISNVAVTSDPFEHRFSSTGPGDYRLQLMRGTSIEALSNPITVGRPLKQKPGRVPPGSRPSAAPLAASGGGSSSMIVGVCLVLAAVWTARRVRKVPA